jgi:hypothetical protein
MEVQKKMRNNPEVVSIENEGSGGQLQRNLAKLRQLGDLTLKKNECSKAKNFLS